jgi:MFS family permease
VTRGARGLTARPEFRRLWIGETTSSLGSSVTSMATPLIALSVLHAGVLTVSVLEALAWLPWLLVGLPAGAWVDRLPRRSVMLTADAVSIAALVSVPVAAAAGALTLAQLLVVTLVAGTAQVFFMTAYRAFLPALLADDELAEGNARLQASESATAVVGPGLAGVIARVAGAVTGLLFDAVTFAVSLVCLRRIGADEPTPPPGRRPLRAEIAEGLRFVRDDRLLRRFMFGGAAANLVLTGYNAVVVTFLVRGIGASVGSAGLLTAAAEVGGVAGAVLAPRLIRRLGSARALLLVKLAPAPLVLLIPLTGPGGRLALFVVGAGAMVAGVTAGNVLVRGFTQTYCPPALMGRISTTTQVVNYGAIPVGALIGGALAAAVGYRPALWVLLAGFALSGLMFLGPLRGLRDLPVRRADTLVAA